MPRCPSSRRASATDALGPTDGRRRSAARGTPYRPARPGSFGVARRTPLKQRGGGHFLCTPRRFPSGMRRVGGYTVFPVTITLREITEDNAESVLALRLAPGQERFVTSVADSLAEAETYPHGNPWFRAVYADGRPV